MCDSVHMPLKEYFYSRALMRELSQEGPRLPALRDWLYLFTWILDVLFHNLPKNKQTNKQEGGKKRGDRMNHRTINVLQ